MTIMTHFQIDSLIMTEVQHQHRFGILQFCRDFLQVVVTQILTAGRELENGMYKQMTHHAFTGNNTFLFISRMSIVVT